MTNTQTQPTNERPSDEVTEEWRSVVGHEGLYEVSSLGGVRRLGRRIWNGKVMANVKGRSLNPTVGSHGYRQISLRTGGKRTTYVVHRLVAAAFIPNPDNLPQINHIDGVKTNNRISNLEWVTSKENNEHAHRIGLRSKRHPCTVLYPDDVRSIKEKLSNGCSQASVAREYAVSPSTIHDIWKGRSWKNVK